MIDDFYRAFEDRHRGSRKLIQNRLRVYLPFIQPYLDQGRVPASLDLGCGRGEWLELLSEAGFNARGVDLNEGMLQACRALRLNVNQGDALAALRETPEASLAIVSAFHLVEHIEFDGLQELVREALRVLEPGGLLILETPNPENIIMAGCNFYLDPSHKTPIPPLLLEFIAGYAGFDRVKKMGLQEPEILRDPDSDVYLLDVLGGVSPDYAIVAQKPCREEIACLFDSAFNKNMGLDLAGLAKRFENRLSVRECGLNSRFDNVNAQVLEFRDNLAKMEDQLQQSQLQIQHVQAQMLKIQAESLQTQNELREAQAGSLQVQAELRAVYASTSWRATRPMRALVRLFRCDAKTILKMGLKRLIHRMVRFGRAHPWFWLIAIHLLNRTPKVKQRLNHIISGAGSPVSRIDISTAELGPRMQYVHAVLIFAANNKKKEKTDAHCH